MIKQVANNWQDWLSWKNYKTPFGPSLITIIARNHIHHLLTRPTNYYFQQNIFSYSKITAVYFYLSIFVYFFCFTFLVLLTAVMLTLFSLTSHTDFSKLSPSLSMLLFLLTFNSKNCTGPEMIPSPGMKPKWKPKWFRSRDEPLFYFFRADPEKNPK